MDAMLAECRAAVEAARDWAARERAAVERAERELVARAASA
jgi:hypothetical protein